MTRAALTGSPAGPRICFVATGLARGGAEVQLFHAVTGLRARGFDVHVVCILSRDYYGARLEEHGVPVVYLNASRTTSPVRILARFLRCIRDVDPVALAGFDYPGAMLARAGGTIARIPVVISSIHSEHFGGRLRRLALAWTDSLATVTTAVSHRMAQKLIDLGAASSRVRVIPNGIDMQAVGPHLRTGRSALRGALGVREHEFLWLAVGRLDEPKDYPNLFAATTLLAKASLRVKLAIAGEGPLRDALRDHVTALRLDEVVSFLGHRGDVPSCMAAADATVLASAWEGLPNVLIESLAVGTPVVCTDVGGAREVVQDGRSGFIVPRQNPEALAAAMSALMVRTDKQRSRMGATGRRHVELHFALDQVLARWSGLFDELLSGAAS
jgi:glycosyltransferase involved in cell wall biosynthesis